MPGSFTDTNVLLYLVSGDQRKADIAEALLKTGVTISVQVLNEFANAGRRKIGLSWPKIHGILAVVAEVSTVRPLTVDTHRKGLELAELHSFAIYDAMIVASALEAECDVLHSEDMHQGLLVADRLRILNPFRN